MWDPPVDGHHTDVIYLAGELVEAGKYKRLGSQEHVELKGEDYLPASLDGRVATYAKVHQTWGQREAQFA